MYNCYLLINNINIGNLKVDKNKGNSNIYLKNCIYKMCLSTHSVFLFLFISNKVKM